MRARAARSRCLGRARRSPTRTSDVHTTNAFCDTTMRSTASRKHACFRCDSAPNRSRLSRVVADRRRLRSRRSHLLPHWHPLGHSRRLVTDSPSVSRILRSGRNAAKPRSRRHPRASRYGHGLARSPLRANLRRLIRLMGHRRPSTRRKPCWRCGPFLVEMCCSAESLVPVHSDVRVCLLPRSAST